MAASLAWYIGWMLAAAGVLLTMRPWRLVGAPTRRRALLVFVSGLGLAATAVIYVPAPTHAPTPAGTLLDPWLPEYQFSEAHQSDVHASREQTYRAIIEVTPDEIALFRTLTWIRRLGRSSGAGILNPTRGASILQTALKSGFQILAEKSNEEIVLGTFVAAPRSVHGRDWTPADFLAIDRPGFVKATMNFRLRAGDLTRVFTETRLDRPGDCARVHPLLAHDLPRQPLIARCGSARSSERRRGREIRTSSAVTHRIRD